MKVCIAGKNNIAVDCLYFLLNLIPKNNICVVLNKTDTLSNNWQKSLGFYAKLEDIPIKNLEEVEKIEDLLFLSLEFDRIIKPEKFQTKKLYNIHFSYLPEYKGVYTSLLPVLHGKTYSGVTLHEIDRGIDTGNIVAQRQIYISNFTGEELYKKYLEEGTKMVCDSIPSIMQDKVISKKQSFLKSTYFSKNSINFSEKEINLNQTGYQIKQFVKAYTFPVYQVPKFKGFEIYDCEILNTKSGKKPGEIIENDTQKVIVSTIDHDVVLYKFYYNKIIEYCATNNFQAASLIIKYVPDLNRLNSNGWSPLIIASYNGANEMVALLLENGANPNVTNLNGTTPLMYAKDSYLKTRDFTIMETLLKSGAKLEMEDVLNKNIFEYFNDEELFKNLKNWI